MKHMENLFFSVNIKEGDSMKKWIALLLSLVMVMSVMNIAAAQEPLTASVAGFGGDVTVTVEVDGEGKIVSIAADGSTQTPDADGNAANTLNEGALAEF